MHSNTNQHLQQCFNVLVLNYVHAV